MDYDGAAKDLREIRMAMEKARAETSRDAGWFFLIQGSIWLIGFIVTQFAPAFSGPLWIALNVLGLAAMIGLGAVLSGKKGRIMQPGLASRIVGITAGILAFDIILVFSFGLTNPRDFTLLLVLSMAFCYFVIGLITRQSMSAMGAVIGLSVFSARILVPSYLYLAIAICGGGSFLAWGAIVLLHRDRADG